MVTKGRLLCFSIFFYGNFLVTRDIFSCHDLVTLRVGPLTGQTQSTRCASRCHFPVTMEWKSEKNTNHVHCECNGQAHIFWERVLEIWHSILFQTLWICQSIGEKNCPAFKTRKSMGDFSKTNYCHYNRYFEA